MTSAAHSPHNPHPPQGGHAHATSGHPVEVSPGESLAADLKAQTSEQHTRAERHPIQAAILAGRIERHDYARLVAQNRHLQDALEEALTSAIAADTRVASVFAPHHKRVANYDADLAALALDPAHRAALAQTASAAAWIRGLAQQEPLATLGVLYVIEGSTNGGQFLSKILARSLGLAGGAGTTALDPHGPRTREMWGQFRASVDALQITPGERRSIIAAACETFDRMGQVMDDVVAAQTHAG